MPRRLRESSDGNAHVVAWENRRGRVFTTKRTGEGDAKLTRNPTDKTVERARRVIVEYDGKYYTAYGINPSYTLDDVISDIESDRYKELAS